MNTLYLNNLGRYIFIKNKKLQNNTKNSFYTNIFLYANNLCLSIYDFYINSGRVL